MDWGMGGQVDTLATAVGDNELSFVSDPKVSCLLPALVKLAANLLVCKSDPSHFYLHLPSFTSIIVFGLIHIRYIYDFDEY